MSLLLCVLQVQGMALNKGLNLSASEEEKEAGQCGIAHAYARQRQILTCTRWWMWIVSSFGGW